MSTYVSDFYKWVKVRQDRYFTIQFMTVMVRNISIANSFIRPVYDDSLEFVRFRKQDLPIRLYYLLSYYYCTVG